MSIHKQALAALIVVGTLCGCSDLLSPQAKKKDPSKGLIGKTTQDIGRFDPEKDQKAAPAAPATDPVTAPLAMYRPMLEKISTSKIDYAVRLFHAQHGRYPQDYDEFMSEIIQKQNIELPKLPGSLKYEYDEQKHTIVVVRSEQQDEAESPAPN